MIDLGLEGKACLVAGAGHRPPRPGIGRATALRLSAAGARVACVDLDDGRARAVADEIGAAGGEAISLQADLRQRDQVVGVVDGVVGAFGRLDVCVDIVGEARWGRVLDFSDDDWDWTLETNLRQAFLLFQTAARQMAAQGPGGAIVAVASVDGFNAARYHVAYGAAKAGLISMVKTFSDELGSSGTRVNAVAPGAIFAPTPDKPTPPPSELPAPLARPLPGDIANGILFLASDLAACVTGQTLAIDGGVSVESAFAFPPEMADRGRAVAKS